MDFDRKLDEALRESTKETRTSQITVDPGTPYETSYLAQGSNEEREACLAKLREGHEVLEKPYQNTGEEPTVSWQSLIETY